MFTFSRFSILLDHDVASHFSVILSASQATLNDRSVQPRVTLVTKPVKCNSVNLRAWRGTPVQGPSNRAWIIITRNLAHNEVNEVLISKMKAQNINIINRWSDGNSYHVILRFIIKNFTHLGEGKNSPCSDQWCRWWQQSCRHQGPLQCRPRGPSQQTWWKAITKL